MARDYYEVLGVPRNADADELQQAYRRLARDSHPDISRDPAAEERFKEVNEAYHVLSDPQLRARYDRFGEDFRQVPEDWDQRVRPGGPRAGAPAGRPDAGRAVYATDGDFGDFGGAGGIDLDDLFGDMFGRGRSGPLPGAGQGAE